MQQLITSSNLKNQLEKGSQLHIEWVNVTRNGKTFKRRQRVKNSPDQHEERKHSVSERDITIGGDSSLSARLKDEIAHSILHEGEFYNKAGERIPLSPAQKQVAIKNRQSFPVALSDK